MTGLLPLPYAFCPSLIPCIFDVLTDLLQIEDLRDIGPFSFVLYDDAFFCTLDLSVLNALLLLLFMSRIDDWDFALSGPPVVTRLKSCFC